MVIRLRRSGLISELGDFGVLGVAPKDDSACEAVGGKCWSNCARICTSDGLPYSPFYQKHCVPGLCAGPADRQCCAPISVTSSKDKPCISMGGTCLDQCTSTCTGTCVKGKCGGNAARQCCLKSSAATDGTKTTQGQDYIYPGYYNDSKCLSVGGICLDNCESTKAPGDKCLTGYCGGPAHRKCSVPSSSGVITYGTGGGGYNDSKCIAMSGTCVNYCQSNITPGYQCVPGQCGGPGHRQCMVKAPTTPPSPEGSGYSKTSEGSKASAGVLVGGMAAVAGAILLMKS